MSGKGAKITWIGHASALLEVAGSRVLVDPLGRGRCRQVGEYRAILITHAHVDHLNRWTLKGLDKSAELYVPKGAAHVVSDLGFARVHEVEPGDQLAIGHADLVCVPTIHDAGRWRKGDGPICTGYVMAGDGVQIHHAGDVDMSTYDVFDQIGKDFKIDATLLPIGGMLPVWYYRWRRNALDKGIHIDPDTALGIAERLSAASMIPIHWGTVNLRLGPPSMPAKRLAKVAAAQDALDRVSILAHGQSLSFGDSADEEVVDEPDAAHPGQDESDENPE